MARTILIVDDNPLTCKTLCEFFKSEEGYEVCAEASNGQEAIDLALKHRPELIILDLSMPVMSGVAASRELKRIMPNVPIILFSQYAAPTAIRQIDLCILPREASPPKMSA